MATLDIESSKVDELRKKHRFFCRVYFQELTCWLVLGEAISYLVGGFIFFIFTPILGEMIQFDEHIL